MTQIKTIVSDKVNRVTVEVSLLARDVEITNINVNPSSTIIIRV